MEEKLFEAGVLRFKNFDQVVEILRVFHYGVSHNHIVLLGH